MQNLCQGGVAVIVTTKQNAYISLKNMRRDHMLPTQCRKMIILKRCAHCDYKTNDRFQLTTHMEISHTQDEPLVESKNEDEIADAIEVWKIYKLLQRLKNK